MAQMERIRISQRNFFRLLILKAGLSGFSEWERISLERLATPRLPKVFDAMAAITATRHSENVLAHSWEQFLKILRIGCTMNMNIKTPEHFTMWSPWQDHDWSEDSARS